MLDILPAAVINNIRDHYITGVARAEAGFEYNYGDEDSLTGGLGQAILTTPEITFDMPSGETHIWSTSHYKFRGRGNDAPEKLSGADGIFQIEVRDISGKIIRQKGLLFQAKKEWAEIDNNLRKQLKKLCGYSHESIVIDYSSNGYKACLAKDANEANADYRKIPSEQFKSLGKTLGEDFLLCRIGLTGLYFDPKEEVLHDPSELVHYFNNDFHVIQTKVRQLL